MDEAVFGGLLAMIGVLGLLWRKDLLGIFGALRLLSTALASSFLRVGATGERRLATELAAVFVLVGMSALLCLGFGLAVRLFYKKNDTSLCSVAEGQNS